MPEASKERRLGGRPRRKIYERSPDVERLMKQCVLAREHLEKSQRRIAMETGFTREHISHLEHRSSDPRLSAVVKYARVLGLYLEFRPLTPDDVLPEPPPPPEIPKTSYVYVAGPMRAHLEKGIHDACKVGDILLKAGIIPFLPQVQALWNMITPHENDEEIYRVRLPFDFRWIDKCDALLRLPGPSPGSDKEVAYIKEQEKPVFYDIEKVLAWHANRINS